MQRNEFRLGIFLLLVACGIPACRRVAVTEDSPTPRPQQQVIAVLNGEEVYARDFRRFLDFAQGELTEDPSPIPTRELFSDFITNRLLLQEAKKQGLTVGEDELRQYVAQWTPRDGSAGSSLKDDVYDYLLAQKLLKKEALGNLEVTLRELQVYYEQHADEFRVGDQAHVLEILMATREEAEKVRARLEDGDVTQFKAIARAESLGVTAAQGGDLGTYERGELPEEFEKVVFGLKPGEISQPFQSSHGFHIFALEEWIPAHAQKFYEVRDHIFDTLIAAKERERVKEYTDQLMKSASLRVVDPNLRLETVENRSHETTVDER
ncbi:MAG: peptidylprolyl isomerase [Acidobacteriota bacterium]